MDQLRAMRYFVAAAEGGSFSAAARKIDVSVPAVVKLVAGLEQLHGVRLFERTTQGLSLTSQGAAYLEDCRAALATVDQADERLRSRSSTAHGTVVVGVQAVIARGFLAAELKRFHAQWPQIQIDLRDFDRGTEEQLSGVDVFLVMGWPKNETLVHKAIGASRFHVVATPEYWRRHGMPVHPGELRDHRCLLLRGVDGTVMDLWEFTRGEERASLVANGWFVASNAHRDTLFDLLMGGEGVFRVLDWTVREHLASGRLACALEDWESVDAPPVNLLFRPSVRRSAAVRAFMDFVTERFAALEAARQRPVQGSSRPDWLKRRYPRASSVLRTVRGGGA